MVESKIISIFENLIEKLYSESTLSDDLLREIKEDLKSQEGVLNFNRFYRELNLMIDTALKANVDRRDYLKFAIISDLERELENLKLNQ
jgi:hypothetical protein